MAGLKAKYTPMQQAQTRMLKEIGVIMERAAEDGAAFIRMKSDPHVTALITEPVQEAGVVKIGIYVPREQFWATMFDKGTLGKRKVPLKQPGRRRLEWQVKRRGKNGQTVEFTARRHGEALAAGGIRPEYFMVRGKRVMEKRLRQYLGEWAKARPRTMSRH